MYTDEDVELIKKRAETLSLLSRADNVTSEQLANLRTLASEESLRNRAHVPALAEYDRFLTSVLELQAGERQDEENRTKKLGLKADELRQRNQALESQLESRSDLDAQRTQIAQVKAETEAAISATHALQAKISGNEEAMGKISVTEVSAIVDHDRTLQMQRAELDMLEREYLKTEETIFALTRDSRAVGESNDELLRICDQLMKKAEAKK